ncbi:MAG: uroporphyrinogen decarboxylase family protein [Eubacteriales bacterium]|nr:uroporphyrinogen decarboxylase family protein [Eubacteriales bacterium]MDD4105112.1 uroporphyrinogen decarboxylase family protein [Eubacteriales bacterium]
MNDAKWGDIKRVIRGEDGPVPMTAIVDSPWMPGYCGINNLDFYAQQNAWFESYVKIHTDFPDITFIPDWWVEYGMAAETSGFGCKMDFYGNNLPLVHHIFPSADETEGLDDLRVPNPRVNGLMPLALSLQRAARPRIEALGETVKMVCTRGPLTIGSYLFGVSEFLTLSMIDPEKTHKLLKLTTTLCKQWLEAQLEAVGTAEAVMVLDDICGMLSPDGYREFAQPYIKDIFTQFPEMIHFFHNDMDTTVCVPFLADAGVDVFNCTHVHSLSKLRALAGDSVVLMGNLPPMSLANDSPEVVSRLTMDLLTDYEKGNGSRRRLLFSMGGGMPMGAQRAQIDAACDTLKEWNRRSNG